MDGGKIIMADPTSATGPSPLDQICLAEAEITQKAMMVREVSEAPSLKRVSRQLFSRYSGVRPERTIGNLATNSLFARLKAEQDFTQMALDERKRADHFRSNLVKRCLGWKREMGKPR
jgi:hypothetical protein